jgi:acetylornithine deacetylase/succinyl-diaminopimelate desuccinylase-like protein
MEKLMSFIDANSDRYIEDLVDLCEKPSVSAQGLGVEDCISVLRDKMLEVGLKIREVRGDKGNPALIGKLEGESVANILGFYNHYDVQPPDPLELWDFQPFKPTIHDGKIYARGAFDNKGSIIARLSAVDAVQKVLGNIPVGLRFLIEGEEEIGSANLPRIVKKNRKLLKADAYFWEGGEVDWNGRPILSLGFKGILTVELEARGTSHDAHSYWAPLLPNPAWKMVWMLSSIKNMNEKIAIPRWYDDVKEISQTENEILNEIQFDEEAEKQHFGVKEYLRRVTEVESRKILYYSNTCNICGFHSGYSGPGVKTVLPSIAKAKLDFRLVEAQNPNKQFHLLKNYLDSLGFKEIRLRKVSACEAAKTPPDDPFVKFVITKLEEVYGSKPIVLPTMAGTSPMYVIRKLMGVPAVSGGGVGYPESNAHSPNENIRINDFIKSIKFIAALIVSSVSFFKSKTQW